MRKPLSLFVSILLIASSCNYLSQSNQSKINVDSEKSQKHIDSMMAAAERPDSIEEEEPSFKDVLADLLASYNQIKKTDTTIIDGKDTLRMLFSYYCLHDSALIIPKHYLWGGDKSKDFITHNFVFKVTIIDNNDTTFNKVITKKDFNNALFIKLQKYATFVNDANFNKYDRSKKEFYFGSSISIPFTDVGVPVSLIVNKNGNCRFLDEYNKVIKN